MEQTDKLGPPSLKIDRFALWVHGRQSPESLVMFLVWLIALALTASQLRAQEPTPQSPPPVASQRPSPFHPHKLAQGHLYSGQIAQAIKTWEQALAKDANDWEALTALGAVLYADGQISRALPYLQRAAAMTEGDWTLRLFLATALHHAGQEAQAAKEFKAMIDGAPNRGTVQIASDKLDGSFFRIEQELQRKARARLGGDLEPGQMWLGQLIRIPWAKPNSAIHDDGTGVSINTAFILMDTFRLPGKKQPELITGGDDYYLYYEHLLFRVFSYAHNRYLVAVRGWKGNPYEKNLTTLTEALQVFEELFLTHVRTYTLRPTPNAQAALQQKFRGVLAIRQKQWTEAAKFSEEALRLAPGDPQAHYQLGLAYLSLSRTEDALKQVNAALKVWPDYAEAHFTLGLIHMKQKRFQEAITAFEKTIELKPTIWEAYFNLAAVYIGLKRKMEAAVALTNAMVIAPHRREEMEKLLGSPRKQE